jgi:hypothetical protein
VTRSMFFVWPKAVGSAGCSRPAGLEYPADRRIGYYYSIIAPALTTRCLRLLAAAASTSIVAKERKFEGKTMVKHGPDLKLAANGRRLQKKPCFTLTNSVICDYRLSIGTAVLWWPELSKRYGTVTGCIAARTGFRHG